MNKECAIAIPVWKAVIGTRELKSLIQCRCMLGQHERFEIMLFGPERLNEGYYRQLWKMTGGDNDIRIIKFPDRCFESRLSYSYLLSSKNFYREFSDFRYILIHQLDAWVLKDNLMDWCAKKYDYIGAPWCHLCRLGKNDCKDYISSSFIGNGGLSLRRVERFVELLPYETWDDATYMEYLNEDVYVSMVEGFAKPDCAEASTFSVESNARHLIESNCNGELPFGFHALNVYDSELYAKLTANTFKGKEIFDNVISK